jgi:Calcineurin-like phosphoesterase
VAVRLFLILLLATLATSAGARAGVGIGMNYNWYKLTLESLHDCKAGQEPQTAGSFILPHYDDARVRATVKRQLRAMHAAGFSSLRILVFHYHDTDPSDDSFVSTDGSIAPADKAKLRAFVGDIAAAGFSTLEVAPAFQAENELFCREKSWGDCFDVKRTDENWRFISEVVQVVRPAAGSMALRYDLGNEQAPDPRMPARALQQAKAYLQTIAKHFQAAHGDDWLFSVARSDKSPPSETSDRLELLLADLAEVDLHPKYLELHTYSADASDMQASLDRANAIAQRTGAKLILGELRYHSAAQASAIGSWLAKNPGSALVDVMQWPELDPSHICAIDPPPPYVPGPLGAALAPFADATPAPAAPGERAWLLVSDIHLDPFETSSDPAMVGSDTNLALFRSVLVQMKRDVPNPAVVLLPGDFFVHDFPHVAARGAAATSLLDASVNTMRAIATAFNNAYPHAQFALALGNNDAPCGDYRSAAGSAYLAQVARIWAPLVDRNGAAPQFAVSFARDGYYSASLPVKGMRLTVLDTVLLSNQYAGACSGASGSATRELAWLNATLRGVAAGERSIVMMHVPPGYDAFTTQALLAAAPGGVRFYPGIFHDAAAKLQSLASAAAPWPYLKPAYNASLIAALTAPENRVAYAIAGHGHRFDFRLAGNVPIVAFGSISPVYHNNPAFYALHVTANGDLRDIDTYAYDEDTQVWLPAHAFDRTWGTARIDAASLAGLHARLGADPALRQTWDLSANGWPSNPSGVWRTWGALWRVPWCAQTVLDGGFTSCADVERRVLLVRTFILAGLLLVLLIVVAVPVLIFRRVRRGVQNRASVKGRS